MFKKISWKKILKFFFVVFAGYILGFASPIILALNYSKQKTDKKENISQNEFVPSPTPDKSKGIWRDIEKSVISPDGKYLAYLADISWHGVNTTELYILEQTNEYTVQRDKLTEIWKTSTSTQHGKYLIVWDPGGNWLALTAQNKIVVVRIDKLGLDEYKREAIKPEVVFETDASFDITGELYLWFEDETLVASHKDGVYELWPQKKKIIDVENSIGIYTASESYLYWQNESECCEVKLMQINKITKKATETGLTVIDYAGKVIVNRPGNKICVETGSSGYYGYVLYDLNSKTTIKRGQQYSNCGQWIDDNQISLIEIPYYHQWSKQIYIYDWRSNTRYPVSHLRNSGGLNPFD